jgi:hypothetical protein
MMSTNIQCTYALKIFGALYNVITTISRWDTVKKYEFAYKDTELGTSDTTSVHVIIKCDLTFQLALGFKTP